MMVKFQLPIGTFFHQIIIYLSINNNNVIFRLLATISVHNNTVPQSVTSSRNNILIQFSSPARTHVFGLIRVTSGFGKFNNIEIINLKIILL